MCCTQASLKKYFNDASPKSFKCWMVFIFTYLLLIVLVSLKWILVLEFVKNVPNHSLPHMTYRDTDYLRSEYHDEAKAFLL